MYEYQNRANTTNYIKLDRNNYFPQKPQRFRDIYINQSPTFYNQYRYDIDNQIPNIPQVQYVYRQKRPFEYHSDDRYENFNNSLKNARRQNDYFFNEFNYKKKNIGKERSFVQRSVNNMTNPNSGKGNEIYYLENNKRITNNSQEHKNKNIIRFNKPFEFNSYNEMNKGNRIYIKNPILNSNNKERKTNLEKNRNTVNTIAQKICNIVIQGEGKKDKNKKNKNKSEKKSENKIVNQNLEINKIQPKNLNLNNINNKNENFNREENEENENEEIEEKEGIEQNENENYFNGKDSNEEYEEEENGENMNNDYYNDNNKIRKEKEKKYEEESIEQYEQNEEEEENGEEDNNREDYQEIEEDEQFEEIKKDSEKKIKKNIYYEIQKKNEIELTPVNKRNKNEDLNIIKDDNIEIHGKKKPRILIINKESNIELIKQEHKPFIEIQKVQNYEQPRDFQRRSNKKKQLKITKNQENDVDIIHQYNQREPNYQIENIQNFKQQREKERYSEKKRNKLKKLKISKLKEANLFIEKTELIEPILEIERVHDFSNLNKRKIPNDKKIINEYEIDTIPDANLFLEKIVLEPVIEIQKVNDYFQKRNKERKNQTKKRKYTLKIAKQKDCNVEIIQNPSITINKQENIEIKSKYPNKKKKTDYKKLKKSIRYTYQFQGTRTKPNEIFIPRETRFVFKGKPKRPKKRARNIIKKEIIYFYKSPINNKKSELYIGGNIQNIINTITKIDLEDKKLKTLSPNNSFNIINLNESKHIIGVSPEKDENVKEYNSNTYPTNVNKNENKMNQKLNQEKEKEEENIENKNDSITIPLKGDKKHFSKAYISPRRLRRSMEGKKEDNKNNDNNRGSLNSVNSFEIKKEEKNETDYSKVNSNVYYSTSFRHPKKEKNKNVENNALFISARSSSSSRNNKNSDSKNENKNSMNRIEINSSNNSPFVPQELENSRLKTDVNNINKISLTSEIEKAKKDQEQKEEEKIVEPEKKEEEKIEQENKKEEILEPEKKEENKMINMNEQISMTSAKNTETTNNYNFLYNYDNLDSQELSEYTRAYLNSYMSAARPELSDFSKQFLSSNETNNFTTKPELSNITRAYLFSQNTSNEEK